MRNCNCKMGTSLDSGDSENSSFLLKQKKTRGEMRKNIMNEEQVSVLHDEHEKLNKESNKMEEKIV